MKVIKKIHSTDSDATVAAGRLIGRKLRGGEIIELVGDVGSGKTTFVKGLVSGLGSEDSVSSPTFTLENIYHGKHSIRHLDLYRLNEAGLLEYGLEEVFDSGDVIIIEWAGLLDKVLPADRITIQFTAGSETKRQISVHVTPAQRYVLGEIK